MKTLNKILGVVLTLAITAGFLVIPVPVAAGTNSWTEVAVPTVTAGTDTNIYTIVADGTTMYMWTPVETNVSAASTGTTLTVQSTAGFCGSTTYPITGLSIPMMIGGAANTVTAVTSATTLVLSTPAAVATGAQVYATNTSSPIALLYKSTDAGRTWTADGLLPPYNPNTFKVVAVTGIKVCPTSTDNLIAWDSANLYRSLNGGKTWQMTAAADMVTGATAVYSADIIDNSGLEILVGTDKGVGLNVVNNGVWKNTVNGTLGTAWTEQAFAVAFAPNYTTTYEMLAVTNNTIMTSLRNYVKNEISWEQSGMKAIIKSWGTDNITTITGACLAFPSDFAFTSASTNKVFVGLNTSGLIGGDVYRVYGSMVGSPFTPIVNDLGVYADIFSVAFNGTSSNGTLVVGEVGTTINNMVPTAVVMASTDADIAISPNWFDSIKEPYGTGGYANVKFASTGNLYVGTKGEFSAFSKANDTTYSSFNAISMIEVPDLFTVAFNGPAANMTATWPATTTTPSTPSSIAVKAMQFQKTTDGFNEMILQSALGFSTNLGEANSMATFIGSTIVAPYLEAAYAPNIRKIIKSFDGGNTWVLNSLPLPTDTLTTATALTILTTNAYWIGYTSYIRSNTGAAIALPGSVGYPDRIIFPNGASDTSNIVVHCNGGTYIQSTNGGAAWNTLGSLSQWSAGTKYESFITNGNEKTIWIIDSSWEIYKWVIGTSTSWEKTQLGATGGYPTGLTAAGAVKKFDVAGGVYFLVTPGNVNGQLWRNTSASATDWRPVPGSEYLFTGFRGTMGSAVINALSNSTFEYQANLTLNNAWAIPVNGMTNSKVMDYIDTTVAAPTMVYGISPGSGPTAGGTFVTISGTGFYGSGLSSAVTAVMFGTTAASNFTVTSNTSITATSPAESAGIVHVTVTTAGGTSATSAADQFTYMETPTVSSISSAAGPIAGGTSTTIIGTGFYGGGSSPVVSGVKFGTTAASSFTVTSNTDITATTPAGSVGTVHVTVTTAGGTSATSSADQFTYMPVPTVISISPTSGLTTGGTSVSITGTGFYGGGPSPVVSAVKFGTTAASSFTVNSSTSITATTPAGSTGSVHVTITTPGGTSATSSADQFYMADPNVWTELSVPTVTSGTDTDIYTIAADGTTMYMLSPIKTNVTAASTGTTLTVASTVGFGIGNILIGSTAATVTAVASTTQFTLATAITATVGQQVSAGAGNYTGALFKSTDAGRTWVTNNLTSPTTTTGAIAAIKGIKVCPTSTNNLVAFDDSGNLYRSVNGSQTWYRMATADTITSGATFINSVDIIDNSGIEILVGTNKGVGCYIATGGVWKNTCNSTLGTAWTQAVYAVAFAPDYIYSSEILAVTNNGANTFLRTYIQQEPTWDLEVQMATLLSANTTAIPSITGASMAFPSNFESFTSSTNKVFVGITGYSSGGGVYRVNGNFSTTRVYDLVAGGNVYSLAYSGTAFNGTLVIGKTAAENTFNGVPSVIIRTSTDADTAGITGATFNESDKNPYGTGKPVVRLASTGKLYVGTNGPFSAFFKANDATFTSFNGISMVEVPDLYTVSFSGLLTSMTAATGSATVPMMQFQKTSGGYNELILENSVALPTVLGDANKLPSFFGTTIIVPPIDSTVPTALNRKLIKSVDAGNTWFYNTTPVPVDNTLTVINILSADAYWIGYSGYIRSNTGAAIALPGSVGVPIRIIFPNGSSDTSNIVVRCEGGTYISSTNGGAAWTTLGSIGQWSAGTKYQGFITNGTEKAIWVIDNSFEFYKWVLGTSTTWGLMQLGNTGSLPAGLNSATSVDRFDIVGGVYFLVTSGNVNGQLWHNAVTSAPDWRPVTGSEYLPNGFRGMMGSTIISALSKSTYEYQANLTLNNAWVVPANGTTNSKVMDYIDTTVEGPTSIFSISPSSGPLAGGTSVTIIGTGFVIDNTTVTIGGDNATNIAVIDNNTLTAKTPAGTAGARDVVVITPDGSATLSGGFTYVPAPTVASVSPVSDSTLGGTAITIMGTNFYGQAMVTIGEGSCTRVIVDNTTQIRATTPSGTAGVVDVVVTTYSGSATLTGGFTYTIPVPTVTRCDPPDGSESGGKLTIITGTNFFVPATVTFGGNPATNVIVDNITQIRAITPAGTAGPKDVVIATPGGSATLPGGFTYLASTSGTISGHVYEAGGTIPIPNASVYIYSTTLPPGTQPQYTLTDATGNYCFSGLSGSYRISAGEAGHVPQFWQNTLLYSDATVVTVNSQTGAADIDFHLETGALLSGTISSGGNGLAGISVWVTSVSNSLNWMGMTGATSTWGNYQIRLPYDTYRVRAPSGLGIGSNDASYVQKYYIDGNGHDTVTISDASGATNININLSPKAPTVTSIIPAAGSLAGGTPITITGTNFVVDNTTVTIGGTAATDVIVDNSTLIRANTPPGTEGAKNVAVTTLGGIGTLTGGYTYMAAPTVTGISPSAGPLAGETAVTITGANFTSGATVSIGGSSCTAVIVDNSTSIKAVAPSSTVGVKNVAVTTPWGIGTLTGGYTYMAVPTVTGFSPSAGRLAGGTAVTITGTNFYSPVTVTIGGNSATDVTVMNTTSIKCTTPAGTAGARDVVVTTPDGSATLMGGFTYIAAPTVTSVSPNSGTTAGGAIVTITGTNFITGTGNSTVTIGGVPSSGALAGGAPLVVIDNTTQIRIYSSYSLTLGAKDVVVTTAGGSGTLVAGFNYTSVVLAIGSISPKYGTTAGGTPVTVKGTWFLNGTTTMTIGGVAATSVVVVDNNTITATTPAGAGAAAVAVTTSGGTVRKFSFYNYMAAPTVTSVSPISGTTVGGTIVTITGTSFLSDNTTVTIGGTAATISTPTATSITATTPSGTAGAKNIVVTTPGGSGTLTGGFTYTAFIAVSSISPGVSPLGGGTAVTITGANFVSGATATIGGGSCTDVSFVDSSHLIANTPSGTAGVKDVVVTNPDHMFATLMGGFIYTADPLVAGISPSSSPLSGGNTVTIYGMNFVDGATVSIGGNSCTNVAWVDSSHLTATTPSGTGTQDVVVINPDLSTSTLTLGFTYMAAPTVTSVSPVSGSTLGGTAITITGTNFYSPAMVTIGEGLCTDIIVDNTTEIRATTPPGTSGVLDLVVITNSGSATLTGGFAYTIPVPTVTRCYPPDGSESGGKLTIITGTNFFAPATVTFGGTPATNVIIDNTTQIRATTPAGMLGATAIVVTCNGVSSAPIYCYTYLADPVVTSVSPDIGPTIGGTSVTIHGANFFNPPTLLIFGGTTATSVTWVDNNTLTAVTPAHGAGVVDVKVTNPDLTSATLASGFTYIYIYTVTYYGNGFTSGTVPTDMSSPYLSGTTVTVLGNTGSLAKTGYTFNNWNTTANGIGIGYAPSDTFSITTNITLYAQWTAVSQTIIYDNNTGSGFMAVTTGNTDASVILGTNTFSKAGYSFSGWNTASGGSGTAYTNGQSITMPVGGLALFAQWTINSYTVIYNSQGGTNVDNNTAAYGGKVTAPTAPTRTGYTFGGWYTEPACTNAWNFESDTMGAADMTLYAKWTVNTPSVTVSITLQGGSRPDAGWIVPLNFKFFTPGADVLTGTPIYSFNLTTAKSGGFAVAQASGIIPGTYDISAVTPHCLANVRRGVVITEPSTAVYLGTLLEGNAIDDNKINITDFGILAASYGKSSGDIGYYAQADFDCNGIINIADFGLLAANYGKNAPVVVP